MCVSWKNVKFCYVFFCTWKNTMCWCLIVHTFSFLGCNCISLSSALLIGERGPPFGCPPFKSSIGCNKLCEGPPVGTTIYVDDFPHLPFAWRLEVCLQFRLKACFMKTNLNLCSFGIVHHLLSFFVNFNEVNELFVKIYRQERERWLRPLELIQAHTCKFPNVGRPCLSPRCVCWWGLCRRSPLKQSCYRRCSQHTAASAKLHFPQFRIRKSSSIIFQHQ